MVQIKLSAIFILAVAAIVPVVALPTSSTPSPSPDPQPSGSHPGESSFFGDSKKFTEASPGPMSPSEYHPETSNLKPKSGPALPLTESSTAANPISDNAKRPGPKRGRTLISKVDGEPKPKRQKVVEESSGSSQSKPTPKQRSNTTPSSSSGVKPEPVRRHTHS